MTFCKKNKIITFILVIAILLIKLPNVTAQGNLPFDDNKRVHFGFSLGINFMDFRALPSNILNQVNAPSIAPGFSVGAISDLRLSKNINLRFTPTLMLAQRTLNFTDTTTTNLLSVPLYTPVYIKYSSTRAGNFRPYLIAGVGAWIDWGRNKEKSVLLKPIDVLIEAGVGCNIYFPFFKLAPEIKYSVGLNNMLTPLNKRDAGALLNPQTIFHTNSINKLTTRMITLTFNFE